MTLLGLMASGNGYADIHSHPASDGDGDSDAYRRARTGNAGRLAGAYPENITLDGQ